MRTPNWNDLRYVLAVSRRDRLAEAARLLGVDDTTVSRRLAALEAATGRRLFHRLADGRLELTEAGRAAATLADRMDREIGALKAGAADSDGVSGVVRLTSVPFVVNRMLVPAIGPLLVRHPQLRVEMISEARNLSLSRREADMALRLARPPSGGMRVKCRRVGSLRHAAYMAAGQPDRAAALPWVSYDETMAHLPQARWMAAAIRRGPARAARLRVSDIETALEAVAAGHGRSLFPCVIADRDRRLRRTPGDAHPAPPSRELWLLVHAELSRLPRIEAVTQWIAERAAEASGSGR